jgi:hypothetical protein
MWESFAFMVALMVLFGMALAVAAVMERRRARRIQVDLTREHRRRRGIARNRPERGSSR